MCSSDLGAGQELGDGDRHDHDGGDQQSPHHSHGYRDGQGGDHSDRHVEHAGGQTDGAGELLVVAQAEQRAAQPQADEQHEGRQGDGEPGIRDADRGDGAEQVAGQVRRRAAGEFDEDDAA